jgi:replicative DNA helicase
VVELASSLSDERDRLQQLLLGADRCLGTRTGFSRLDELLGDGLQPGHLVLLGSRPGHGKTSLALQMAATAAVHHGQQVAVFSPETPELQLVQRLWGAVARVGPSRLRTASLKEAEWPQAHDGYQQLRASQIYVDDSFQMDAKRVGEEARRLSRSKPPGLVVVDSLQGLAPGSGAAPMQQLKRLARELSVPVVVTVRLAGRERGHETGEAGLLDELRDLDDGSLEPEADVVLLLSLEPDLDPALERSGEADLYVSKNRAGPRGTVSLCFLDQRGAFAQLAHPKEARVLPLPVPHSTAWQARR